MTALVFEWTRRWARGSETVRSWRENRYRLFLERCGIEPGDRIIDVGAGLGLALERYNDTNPITAVDLVPQHNEWLARPNVLVVQGDGTQLAFGDREFDAAFSSSVIEHVPRELHEAFASEIRRVARRYFVQTPNRWFLIEPHYQLPLFHFLPKRVQRALNRRFTLGWQTKGEWEDIHLLSARDLRRLFPDATIHRERVFGLTKSLMAVR
jgi:2-polyprenyl-3-methyl-5-hydroxy-6-metoxy-1,4-benzoquinol methylase